VFISVADGTTEFLCLPCFVKLASDLVHAVTSPEAADVLAAVADTQGIEYAPVTRNTVRGRGHNAPATTDDPDLLDAFDSRITVEELPDEFR
jgi:hypothetical protein